MDIKQLTTRALEVRTKYSELEQKRGKEWNTLNIMEGFVGDVGDLMKLVMAKEGLRHIENVDDKIAHELSDCLWSILVLAEKYEINLEENFMETMDKLTSRIEAENK